MNKYLDKIELDIVSNCCGAKVLVPDICSECKEHCQVTTIGAYLQNMFKDMRRDIADIQEALEQTQVILKDIEDCTE